MKWDIDEENIGEVMAQPTVEAPTPSLPMTVVEAKDAIESARNRLQQYADIIKDMVTEANLLAVDSEETLQVAVELGIRAKKLAKEIDGKKDEIMRPALDFEKAVRNFAKSFTASLFAIEEITKRKSRDFKLLQEQREREAQKKIEEEMDKLREKIKEEADKAGVPPVEVPTPVLPKVPKVTRTDSGSAHTREFWAFRVTEPHYIRQVVADLESRLLHIETHAILAEIPVANEGLKPLREQLEKLKEVSQFQIFDEKEIRKSIDGGRRKIEGVEIFRDDKIVYR